MSPEPEKLELTLARIAGIVGEGNVGMPELLDTHRPQAFEVKHFNQKSSPPVLGGVARSAGVVIKTSVSLRIFRPPLEATVQLHEGIPVWIAFTGVHGPIKTASGPWLGSGDWWNERHWDREEWDIEVSSALYRIYLDTTSSRWFAEGAYD